MGQAETLTLAYRLKLSPTRVKSDMLGMLCDYFAREQHKALDLLDGIVAQEGRLVLKGKSQAGQGEFKQRVRYRAVNDYKRARKAAKALKKQLLRAWCQRCHLTFDAQSHSRHAAETRRRKKSNPGQQELFL